ncbi:flavin reductase family protein [uncultured Paracoccus sp.]|uniref:flavin reductase family protein n=1 Tax=uncultured Paracoccus sp. TaxID=189685 RepID=UPI002600A713|nr:flavin reductase family protein [uncultured Paracoccus sp.]
MNENRCESLSSDRETIGYPSIDLAAFKAAMRNLSAGVTIVSTGQGAQRRGLTVSAACSLSGEPPSVLVCLNTASEAVETATLTGSFAVNFLGFDQLDLALRFAGHGGARHEAKFDMGSWTRLSTGAPVLANALCSVDCELAEAIPFGSHMILIGRIVDTVRRVEGEPLMYFRGQFAQILPKDFLDGYVESGFEA